LLLFLSFLLSPFLFSSEKGVNTPRTLYEAENVVKQEWDPLDSVTNYMDDILITSTLRPTYSKTLAAHFQNVEQAVERLAFHGAKINVMNSEWARSKILFLGWYISNNFIVADPSHMEKVIKFLNNKKSARAFLGLVNSLRRVIPTAVIEQFCFLDK
jgi:hypothetical protein